MLKKLSFIILSIINAQKNDGEFDIKPHHLSTWLKVQGNCVGDSVWAWASMGRCTVQDKVRADCRRFPWERLVGRMACHEKRQG